MIHELNWPELARYLAGECSPEEEAALREWAAADPARGEIVESARRAWLACRGDRRWDTQAAWGRMQERLDAQPAAAEQTVSRWRERARRIPWGPGRGAVAAALVAVVGGGMLVAATWAGMRLGSRAAAVQELVTRKGERAQMRLSDGTRVVLGPGSRLSISKDFGAASRKVRLSGHAYFDVAPDESRPFIVAAGDARTEVLGTAFAVRAYPTDSSVQVVVAEGRVALGPGTGADPDSVLLLPGEMGEIAAGRERVTRHRVELDRHLGWLEGRLLFDDTPLSQVAKQLERWYGVPVRMADPSLGSRRLTASFRDQPVDEVMAVIAASLGLEFAKTGQVYTFFPRGKFSALATP